MSASRQALIFSLRQTQHKPSDAPAGVSSPQTTHFTVLSGITASPATALRGVASSRRVVRFLFTYVYYSLIRGFAGGNNLLRPPDAAT